MKDINKINGMFPLKIQLFAEGDEGGEGGGDNGTAESLKFGNVEITQEEITSLPENLREKLGLVNKSYTESRKQVSTFSEKVSDYEKKLAQFQQNNGKGSQENDELMNNPVVQQLLQKVGAIESKMNTGSIENFKAEKRNQLVNQYGQEKTTEIFNQATKAFDERFKNNPGQRTAEMFELFLNQEIALASGSRMESMYDPSNKESFGRMMQDENFVNQMKEYFNSSGDNIVNFMTGSGQGVQGETEAEFNERISKLSRPERVKEMQKRMENDLRMNGIKDFINKS